MKKIIQIIAIILPVAGVSLWAAQGMNTGWTKTQIEIQKIDEITEIEYTEYEDKLTFGIELPVLSFLAGAGLFGVSLLVGRKSK